MQRDYKAFTNDPKNVRGRSRAIGRELRRSLDHVIMEPIPDDMYELLIQVNKKLGGEWKWLKS